MRNLLFAMTLAVSSAAHADPPRYFDWLVTSSGLGPVHLGMSVEEASVAFGRDITKPDVMGAQFEECSSYFFGTRKPMNGVRFLVARGFIKRIDIWTPSIKTDKGVQVASSVADVRAAYPGLKEFIGHYQGPEGSVVLSTTTTIRFEFGSKGVERYRIGLSPEVDYIEGCL